MIMQRILDEKQKAAMQKDGSTLKYMYSVAGAGKGLAAGGWTLLVIGLALTAMVSTAGVPQMLVMGAVTILPGVLLVLLGKWKQDQRDHGWVQAYAECSGISEADVPQADAEFLDSRTAVVGVWGGDKNAKKKAGFVSPNYFKVPGIWPRLYRLQDVSACFFTDQFICEDGGYAKAVVIYGTSPERCTEIVDISEKRAAEIIGAVKAAAPSVITDRCFQYEGQTYDALEQREQVVALYNHVMGQSAQ